jgi:hypothetical protein
VQASTTSTSNEAIQCHRHCKEWGGERSGPLHHHIHQKEVHMQLYIKGVCADEVDE